jgi:site-specific recombinase XerC
MVRPFLAGREQAGGLSLGQLRAAEVTAFVLATCPGMPKGSAKLTVTALRSLLGFLHVEGLIGEPPGQHVPAVASWRLAGLPRALEPGQVEALLASCDQRTAVGRRDFAMLTLLARLGLRAGEVAALTLEDIDWRSGEITVRGKGSRCEWLPGAAGWTAYFPAWSVQHRLRLPACLHPATGHPLAAPQAPGNYLEGTPATLLHQRMVARRR